MSAGIGYFELKILVASKQNIQLMNNILNSRWQGDQGEDGQEEWYDWIIEELKKAASSSFVLGFDRLSSIDTAMELFEVTDHFNCEEGLNTDGFWTYVRVIENPLLEANRLAEAIESFRATSELLNQESLDVVNYWESDLIKLERFLRQITHEKKSPAVQLLTSMS